jgi:hypothetical protein
VNADRAGVLRSNSRRPEITAVGCGRQRAAAQLPGRLSSVSSIGALKLDPRGHRDDQSDLKRFAIHGLRELDRLDLVFCELNPDRCVQHSRRQLASEPIAERCLLDLILLDRHPLRRNFRRRLQDQPVDRHGHGSTDGPPRAAVAHATAIPPITTRTVCFILGLT